MLKLVKNKCLSFLLSYSQDSWVVRITLLEAVTMSSLFLACDIGTGSARAGIFTADGKRVGYAEHPLRLRDKSQHVHIEQSTEDIWGAICVSVRNAISSATIAEAATRIVALGIDATCSLAVLDSATAAPLSVVQDTSPNDVGAEGLVWNVVLWLDHRAEKEAEYINSMRDTPEVSQVLSQLGGRISVENQPPKLLWLQRHLPEVVQRGRFFDLADWAAFRCTGVTHRRSSCTLSCKWGWAKSRGGWSADFWSAIGLKVLTDHDFNKIGREVLQPGTPFGSLTADAAQELGLPRDCVVATPLIDAHCGALGVLGGSGDSRVDAFALEQRLAMVCGTSTCHLALSQRPVPVTGIWGPFLDAVVPNRWCTEAGQSVSGALLKHLVEGHAAYRGVCARVGENGVFEALNAITCEEMARDGVDPARHVHVLDSFSGNRSPFSDASFRGMVSGLDLASGERELAVLYRAAVQSLCYGARLIIERMNESGHAIDVIFACGGMTKNGTFLQELADVCQMRVVVTAESEAVLLGGAILASAALVTCQNDRLVVAMRRMSAIGHIFEPVQMRYEYHQKKYAVYLEMCMDFKKYQEIMINA